VATATAAVAMTTTPVAMTTIRGDAPKVRDRSAVALARYYFVDFTTGSECDVC
jgi:hypothetical protein